MLEMKKLRAWEIESAVSVAGQMRIFRAKRGKFCMYFLIFEGAGKQIITEIRKVTQFPIAAGDKLKIHKDDAVSNNSRR